MKLPPPKHRWSMSPKAAIRLQHRLAGQLCVEPLAKPVNLVAGVDLAFTPDKQGCVAGVVVYDLQAHAIVEEQLARRPARFPYIPGLLSFRETPAALAAIRKLQTKPDVFLFDAQGFAHPRRLGLAAHAGLLMDRPAIGCAKSRLCGTHEEPPARAGGWASLMHRDELIGAALRTQKGINPVYVSVGYRVTLEDAIRIVMACLTRYRLPEPARLAHLLVTRNRDRV